VKNQNRRGNAILVLTIVGIILLVGLMCCGGMAAFLTFGWGIFTEQAKDAMNENAVIQEHIGRVTSIESNFLASADEDNENVFVFEVEGSKGTGTVTAEFITVDDDTEEIRSGTLELPSGDVYELVP